MLLLPSETINGFIAAAGERFAEGTALMERGHGGGAIYLFGYVAELVLKAAAYRQFGYGVATAIKAEDRKAVEDLMKQESLAPKGPHDILKWAKWLVLKCGSLTGTAYTQEFGIEIETRADLIDRWWSPSLRYHVVRVAFLDTLVVQSAARWFLDESDHL
jgi:hypothetical protein